MSSCFPGRWLFWVARWIAWMGHKREEERSWASLGGRGPMELEAFV